MALTRINNQALLGATGSIIQVVSAELAKDTSATTTSTSYIDTGLSASITPKASGNKIKITVAHNQRVQAGSNNDLQVFFKLLVGSTELDAVEHRGDNLGKLGDTAYHPFTHFQTYIYTTTDTSTLTFKTQVKIGSSSVAYYKYNDCFIILDRS